MILNGKAIADRLLQSYQQSIQSLPGRKPGLGMLIVGDNPASQIYVQRKRKTCEQLGMLSKVVALQGESTQEQLLAHVEEMNADPSIDAFLVQLPLPSSIDTPTIMHAIAPHKDADGFHPVNMGKLLLGEEDGLIPCTPRGVQVLLQEAGIPTAGRRIVIVGRSNIVGKPLAALLMQKKEGANATVTVVHSHSRDLADHCRSADILIACAGQHHLIDASMVKEGASVIDVGIHRISDTTTKRGYHLAGDVDFDDVAPHCEWITPVPGGVGPMTIAMLMANTLQCYHYNTTIN